MKVKVLGTQSPYSKDGNHCPGFLISHNEYKIMLDCGSGSHSLLDIPNDFNNFYGIITHLHEDHYNDIGILQYAAFSNHNLKLIDNPINICLPSTPEDKYKKIINEKDSYASYTTLSENLELNIGDMKVNFFKTDHPIETYAVKVSNNNMSIVYTSDSSFSAKDKIVKFAKNADLLICESSLLTSHGFPEINSHLTAKQAGIIAKEANVKKLMLTHFWPEESIENYLDEAKSIFSNVIGAKEGQIIDISKIH